MKTDKKICFIGAGNMTEAFLKGLIKKQIFDTSNIFCIDINTTRLDYISKTYKANCCVSDDTALTEKLSGVQIFVLSVKPQNLDDIAPLLAKLNPANKILISILAGIKIGKLQRITSQFENVEIIRVMPNTPSLVGEGALAYSFAQNASQESKNMTSLILSSLGVCEEVHEKDLDAITALSGSGPAYVFYLAEAMIEAGIEMGLSQEISTKLAIQTIFGAGFMMKSNDDSPQVLRQKVTSKGGTTEAAINYFDDSELKKLIKNGLEIAKQKSIELSKS